MVKRRGYEYRVISRDDLAQSYARYHTYYGTGMFSAVQEALNAMSQDGWELVGIDTLDKVAVYAFKRRLPK